MAIGPDKSNWIEHFREGARILETPVIRDDQELTAEMKPQILTRFDECLKRLGKSREAAARSMGIGAATLSQVCSSTYPGDTEKHFRIIDKWVEAQIQRERAPKPSGYVVIRVAQLIYALAVWAMKINGIALASGPAGIGKTMSALAIHAQTPGSVYIPIRTAGQSKLSVLESLGMALRLGGLKLTSWQLFQQLVGVLKDTNRLIIVDEVHKLVGRRKDEALHVLRDLYDATGCPMLWLGMSNIAEYIQTGKSQYEPLDQLHSRIKAWLDLKEVATCADGESGLYSIEDIQKVFAASKMRLTGDAIRYLQMLANEYGSGALRTAVALVQISLGMPKLEGNQITAEILRDIRAQLIGRRAADAFEQQMKLRAVAIAG